MSVLAHTLPDTCWHTAGTPPGGFGQALRRRRAADPGSPNNRLTSPNSCDNLRGMQPALLTCPSFRAKLVLAPVFLAMALVHVAHGQVSQPPRTPPGTANQALGGVRPDYRLGPEDQIVIRTPQVSEINERPFRIDSEGFVELPIVGRIRAAGLTIQAFEQELSGRLAEYVRDPQVFVTLAQFRGDPVFFNGAFNAPGIYPLTGSRTLVEMLTVVGGLQPNAARRIKITRRLDYGALPLPNAVNNPETRISTVEISLSGLSENINPEEDIILQPFDIVSVERAERVYVSGEVARAASIELGERNSISVIQALTEAGGFTPTAKRGAVRILRPISGTDRRAEIVIDANLILAGRIQDFPLLPNDVLYVPSSKAKTTLASIGTGLVASLPFVLTGFLVQRR
jgi:polysaccharide biosynthesis/export protein